MSGNENGTNSWNRILDANFARDVDWSRVCIMQWALYDCCETRSGRERTIGSIDICRK